MASVVISSILSLGTKLVTTIQSSPSNSSSTFENDLRWIMRTLERIQATLSDMERREIGEEAVKLWLKELKEVAYDAEDVLDEYYYEVTKAKVEARGEEIHRCSRKRKLYSSSSSSRLSSYFPSSSLSIKFPTVEGMAERMKAIRSRIEEIAEAWEKLRLREEDGRRQPSIKRDPPQLLTETRKEEVIDLLLSAHDNKVAVVAIVGKRGLGKTTLAKLVYEDQRLYGRFSRRAWIHVYENFDVKRLTKAIVESFTANSDLTELSKLQDNLMNLVRGQNVLLVLDDMWIERPSQWELLRAPLMVAKTATILMTTRNVSVSKIMQAVPPYFLDYLPEDQCWSLFKHYAFTGVDSNEQPNLVEIGRQIMNKCGGLPLAVKLLASLLGIKANEDSWRDVLESDLWQSQEEDETLIALEISYQHMPPHLKPCFCFFSMFPKDHDFNKYELFRLWVAQGYVQSEGTKIMDEIAFGYVDELTERSFLEQCDFVPFYTSYDEENIGKYRMHNLVHDLAIKMSGDKHFQTADDVLPDLARVRHLHISSDIGSVFLRNPTALRTLVVDKLWNQEENLLHVISKSPNLRALVLRGHIVMGFPDSIRNLKNLRYLRLHRPILETLGKCVCLLYNLQILILNGEETFDLPKEIGNLVNLRYLKISGFSMWKLPKSICFLRNLQILILYSYDLDSHDRLDELPEGLGNLVDLRHLQVCSCQIQVLPRSICQLNHLQRLILRGCERLFDLPGLIGNLRDLRDLNLVDSGVKYIPLGIHKLTALQSLKGHFIVKVGRNYIGMGFLRDLVNLQGNLKIYNLGDIANPDDAKNADLKSKCNLMELTLSWWKDTHYSNDALGVQLEADTDVVVGSEIDGQILEFLQPHTNLNKLRINGYRATAFPSWMTDPFSCASLASISIQKCFQLRSLYFCNLSSVKSLIISKCHNLQNLVEGSLPSRLQSLCINDCWRLKLLDGLENLMSLKQLDIYKCRRLSISPTNSLPDKLLPENITICGCRSLTEWCQQHNITAHEHGYFAWGEFLEANDEDNDMYETDEEDDEDENEEEDDEDGNEEEDE